MYHSNFLIDIYKYVKNIIIISSTKTLIIKNIFFKKTTKNSLFESVFNFFFKVVTNGTK